MAAAVTVVAALLASGCSEEHGSAGSRERCEDLRDRLVDLRMASVTTDREAHRASLRASLDEGGAFVRRCVDELSSDQVTCGLAATDPAALGRCVSR